MTKKRKPPVIETHGALEFQLRNGPGPTCGWSEHKKAPGLSGGRWLVFLAGYPFVDERGREMRVCSKCMAKIISIWEGALGEPLEKVA